MNTHAMIALLAAAAVFSAAAARAQDEAVDERAPSADARRPAERSDSWITAKVKGALLLHKNVSSLKTDVETRDGVVTLRGEADNEQQRELASEYAREIEGVKDVDNRMTVKGASARRLEDRMDDAAITTQVKSALLFNRSTSAVRTSVKTVNGVVTLTGKARNEAEKDLVERLVKGVRGVKRVDNRMTLEHDSETR